MSNAWVITHPWHYGAETMRFWRPGNAGAGNKRPLKSNPLKLPRRFGSTTTPFFTTSYQRWSQHTIEALIIGPPRLVPQKASLKNTHTEIPTTGAYGGEKSLLKTSTPRSQALWVNTVFNPFRNTRAFCDLLKNKTETCIRKWWSHTNVRASEMPLLRNTSNAATENP